MAGWKKIKPLLTMIKLSNKTLALLGYIFKNKGDETAMNLDNDHYERKGVTLPIEVKETYEYARANNIQYYRCVSNSGLYFGWMNNTYIKAADGQEWFENPDYVAPIKIDLDKPIDDEVSVEGNSAPLSKPVETEDMTYDQIPEKEAEMSVDVYKALYEEQKVLFEKAQEEALKYATLYGEVSAELEAIKTAFAVIAKELEESKLTGE